VGSEHPQGAKVCVDERGILRIVIEPGARLDDDSTRQMMARTFELAAGRQLPTLVDARGVRAMSLGARQLAASDDVAAITKCLAILVGGPVSVVIGNFFMRVTRPRYPTRLFTDMGEAERWLVDGRGAKHELAPLSEDEAAR
jgi:anti-anti-sigma regulatory factor